MIGHFLVQLLGFLGIRHQLSLRIFLYGQKITVFIITLEKAIYFIIQVSHLHFQVSVRPEILPIALLITEIIRPVNSFAASEDTPVIIGHSDYQAGIIHFFLHTMRHPRFVWSFFLQPTISMIRVYTAYNRIGLPMFHHVFLVEILNTITLFLSSLIIDNQYFITLVIVKSPHAVQQMVFAVSLRHQHPLLIIGFPPTFWLPVFQHSLA